MTDYPTLSDMGIKNHQEISHYSLRQDGPDSDILRIYYKRAKGSLLPFSRKYKFGRSIKTVVADSGRPEFADTYEISPFLLKAMSELDQLVADNKLVDKDIAASEAQAEQKALAINELNRLERTIRESLDDDKSSAMEKMIDDLRRRIEEI